MRHFKAVGEGELDIKGASINYGRGGTENLGKIYLAFLAIPPIKRKWNFVIPPI